MEYYSIYEVAKMLNTSHTTVYNKLKNKEVYKLVKEFIKITGKSKSISMEGIEILKEHIQPVKEKKEDTESFINDSKQESKEVESANNKLVETLEKQIQSLEKDKEELYKQMNMEKQLHAQTLLALGNEQKRTTKLLEDFSKKEEQKPWYKRVFNK